MSILFLRGLLLGFSIAAPVGPIGVLCIRRTLAHGRAAGFVSGLGAASADAVYGAIAGFGLSAVSELLVRQQTPLRLLGGLFLCYLGIKTFLARQPRPADTGAPLAQRGLAGAYGSVFLLTLTNPVTILAFAAAFAGLGLAQAGRDFGAAGAIVLGVFLGSATWWLLLSTGVGLLRARVTPGVLRWVNRGSGLVILAFAVAALVSTVV